MLASSFWLVQEFVLTPENKMKSDGIPSNTQRRKNVVTTSPKRRDVERRYNDVIATLCVFCVRSIHVAGNKALPRDNTVDRTETSDLLHLPYLLHT